MPKRKDGIKTKQGFEVVSSSPASVPSPGPTASIDSGPNKKQKKGVNSLRNAHANSSLSASDKKANELWFRKAGYGPILFKAYYANQSPGVITAAATASLSTSTDAPLALPPNLSKGAKKKLKKKLAKQSTTNAISESGEFEAFMDALARPLPIAFRVRQSVPAVDLPRVINSLSTTPLTTTAPFDPITTAGCGTHRIYTCDPTVHKKSIAKHGPLNSSPLAVYLATATHSGITARQELVSMLPVIALSCLPTTTLLDLCASPGSKTMQALEVCHAVVANDIHPLRTEALKDAVIRASLPPAVNSRLILATHDGSQFPVPLSKSLLFDKVMADVPCSGDGTIRKDLTIMPRWNPSVSNKLHPVQVSIGRRGLECVKVGGTVCYSSCTFNPMENEAVVQELVRWGRAETGFEDGVEVVPFPEAALPGLVRRPGVRQWKVADYVEKEDDTEQDVELRWHDSFEAAKAMHMDGPKTLWPRDDNENMKLHLCNRLVPQDAQDSGGFFVALLRKNRPFKREAKMQEGRVKGGEHEEVYRMLQKRVDELE